jgi:hypothetical protein
MDKPECVELHLCIKTSKGGFIIASSNTSRAESITYWLMTPREKREVEYYVVLVRDEQAVDFKCISKEWADFLLEKWR